MTNQENNYVNGRCCVFQPFDKGDFDKRFDDTLAPAIEGANMEPYRVDRDHGAVIPIDTLHAEIKSAVICVADITTRNPNVMYELGYAIAAGKDVVIISGPSSEKYPFDIQHRGIIPYSTGSMSDFKSLGTTLTERLIAILKRQEKTQSIIESSPVKASNGIEPHEVTAMALILANCDSLDDHISANWLKQEMRKANYTEVGTRIALARLTKIGYTVTQWLNDGDSPYVVYGLTELGENWLIDNQEKLQLETRASLKRVLSNDEDIPF